MMSGALLTVYPVGSKELNSPAAFPGALRKKFCVVVTAPSAVVLESDVKPRPPSVACGPSTESPSATLPPKSFTTRKAYARSHVKPTTYWGSIIIGNNSWRLLMPLRFSVASVHICPPVKDQPLSNITPPHLPLPERLAVALPVVRRHAGVQEVTFVISCELGSTDLALEQCGCSCLPGCK